MKRWMTGVGIAAAAMMGTGCGAKTGLVVPCDFPTERVAPTVAALDSRSASMWISRSYRETPAVEASLQVWEQVLPMLNDVAVLGGTWQPAYGDPRDDPATQPPECTVFPNLLVPFARNNSARVIELYRNLLPRWRPDALGAAMETTVRDLVTSANAHSPKWIILTNSAPGSCGTSGDPGDLTPSFRSAFRQGVRVMLIAVPMPAVGETDFSWDRTAGTDFNAFRDWSSASGAVRSDGRASYWVWTEQQAITSAVNEYIVRPFYCRVRAAIPEADHSSVELMSDSGLTVPRGTGWRFDPSDSSTVEVLEPHCTRVAQARATLRFVSTRRLCYQD